MSVQAPAKRELLMVGMSAKTYRIGDTVRKECHVLPDDIGITKQNLDACKIEAQVYRILGDYPLIARCLSIGAGNEYIELEYYPHSTLTGYIQRNRMCITEMDLKRWAYQIIKSVAYIHSKGVRHSDFRLDQWLVDADLNARLSDFNAAGFDDQPDLGIKGEPAQGLESASHCLPRDPEPDNTVVSDLFALGSTLYELLADQAPYEGQNDEVIESSFRNGEFPSIEGLLLGGIIQGCWKQMFSSAEEILDHTKNIFG